MQHRDKTILLKVNDKLSIALKMKDVYITVKEDFPELKRNIEDILKKTEL